MGYGATQQRAQSWSECIVAKHGTWNELKKLRAAQAAEAKALADGGESLLTIPHGKYPKLDAFDDLLETGARVAKQQRKWLVGIPVTLMMFCVGICAVMGYQVFSSGAFGKGLSAAEVISQYYKPMLIVCSMLTWVMVFMLSSLSPTNIKGICYMCIGLIATFIFCGFALCPFGMPLLFPDRTGTAYKIWMVCAMVKCVAFSTSLIWALLTQPPRKCLRVMEWGLMGVIIGYGAFTTLAAYFCVKDSGMEPPAGYWPGFAIMSAQSIFGGFIAVTSYPRAMGRLFLARLHKWSSPTTSFDFQCLAATISIMVGADANFRQILCKALDSLRAISMADVTWDDFRANTPDPKCYDKSRPVSFEQVDFFISHSWSDDPHAKWQAIQKMRNEFKATHGREPLVWFDKYCIDQHAIDSSVRRLPIFVNASSKFFVLFGPSYAARCWCMLELYVFNTMMRSGLFKPSDLILAPLAGNTVELEKLAQSFNIHDTKCFRDVDRQTIFAIIETAGDGHKGFDQAVRTLSAIAAGEVPPAEEDAYPVSSSMTAWHRAGAGVGQEMHHRGKKTSAPPSPPSPPMGEAPEEQEEMNAVEEDLEACLP